MITQPQLDAALKALQDLRSKDVPAFEQGSVTDSLLEEVAALVVDAGNADAGFAALQKYRDEDVPWLERGFISDDLLRNLVSTVLDATKGIA